MAETIPTLGRGYTDKEEAIIRKGVAQGLSGDGIRRLLPVARSRSAVIGKANRMGLSLGGGFGDPPRAPKGAPPPASKSTGRRPSPPPHVAEPRATTRAKLWPAGYAAVGLVGLGRCVCRWPVGRETGADQLFCGEVSPEGKPYCDEHQGVAGGQRRDLNKLWDGKGAAPRWARQ